MTEQVWNTVEADIAQHTLLPIKKRKDEVCYIIKSLTDWSVPVD